ncbi:MAG: hypothetical protein ACRDI2_02370 [Chloroflexota bacterium]
MVATVLDPDIMAADADDRETLATLDSLLERGEPVRLVSGDTSVELPASLVRLVAQCVRSLEQNQPVTLLPLHRMLLPEEAADLLNVPRVNLNRLLTQEGLPVTYVEGEPRIRADRLLAYREQRAQQRRQALNELIAVGQEIDPEPSE